MFVLLYETAPPEIYTLSLHDALPISGHRQLEGEGAGAAHCTAVRPGAVHALGGQDARETLELVVSRRRPAEVVPERSHRRAQLLVRGARPDLPAHANPAREASSYGIGPA